MRVYPDNEMENLRAQRAVREWGNAGLITVEQRSLLEKETQPQLQSTSFWLRAVIFLFTFCVGVAFVALLYALDILRHPSFLSWFVLALLAYGVAEYVISRRARKLYCHGVEEALVFGSLVFFALGTHMLIYPERPWAMNVDTHNALIAFLVAAACAVAYGRFGFSFTALGSIVALAAVPAFLLKSPVAERLAVVAILGVLWILMQFLRASHRGDVHDEEFSILQAILVLGVYLALNLRLSSSQVWKMAWSDTTLPGTLGHPHWFYWLTYIAIWMIPLLVLVGAIRRRERALLIVGIFLALLTLSTNKPYLGWTRHEWDPMLLGVLLMGTAIAIRRWLAAGPGGMRSGYTAESLSTQDKRLMNTLGTVSAAWHPAPGSTGPATHKPDLGGGRSGGAGASEKW